MCSILLVDLRIFFGQEFVSRYDSRRFISSIACKSNKRRRRRWTWHQNVRRDALHVEISKHITLLRYKRKTKATANNNRTMGKTDITVTKRNGKYAAKQHTKGAGAQWKWFLVGDNTKYCRTGAFYDIPF